MKNKKLKICLILMLIIVIIIMSFCILNIYNSLKKNNQKEIEVIDMIDSYGYKLDENDSEYFKILFDELKSIINASELDEKEYANIVAKLFITDFYSLKNAISKNDIGGVQFIYKPYQSTFVSLAKDSIYKYVESNLYGKREQVLPTVKEVVINNNEISEINLINDELGLNVSDSEAYYINATIIYEEELEYPSNIELILAHNEQVLEIVSLKEV